MMTIGEVIELVKIIFEQIMNLISAIFGSEEEGEAEGEGTVA